MRTPLRPALVMPALVALATTTSTTTATLGEPPDGVRVGDARTDRAPGVARSGPCVPAALRASVRAAVARERTRLGLDHADQGGLAGPADARYRFHPTAGAIGADVFNGGFVDLDPSPGAFHDFDCRPWTYDGHRGLDVEIRSFAEQVIGVPVHAARDGVVVFAQDGFPDMELGGGIGGNIVSIDHGDGTVSESYHLRMGSVLVDVGDTVVAGQPIGEVGSSGNSFGPHLHFETVRFVGDEWIVVEPFAGACRPGESGWVDQAPLDTDDLVLHDFGVTRTDLATLPDPWWEPWPLPTDGQVAVDDPAIVFWWRVFNFPADCLVHVEIERPDGSLAVDAAWNWGNPERWRIHKNWLAWDLAPLDPAPGTWRLRFALDGVVLVDAPVELVDVVDESFNRAPHPISTRFLPARPLADDVVRCVVEGPSGLEDADWDVVRYRYRWTVDGEAVRDVVTAARGDLLRRDAAATGARLACEVTAFDDRGAEAPAVSTAVTVAGLVPGDLDGDGDVDGADLAAMLGSWGACEACAADFDADGSVGGGDLAILLGGWTG